LRSLKNRVLMKSMSLELVAESFIFIFPAYTANAIPVIFGGGTPLDFGRIMRDGRPVFGAHKTFRGFFAGLAVGALVGFAEGLVFNHYSLVLGFMLSLGALLGDLGGAFAKRRLGIAPGSSLPVVDQIDFVLCALLFSLPVSPPTLAMTAVILAVTIPLHLLTNLLAYLVHLKRKPW
jgi:CDP-2,3-bis-(O-geranylgeranyl)-sn-glycerol synthase